MSVESDIAEIVAGLKNTLLSKAEIRKESDNTIYLRYDFQENEDGDSWEEYYMVQEELGLIGFILTEYECEHDCITGSVVRIDNPSPDV